MTLNEVLSINGKKCSCGKIHSFPSNKIYCGKNAISQLPETIKALNGTKAFILNDRNTFKAAGEKVCNILDSKNISYTNFTFNCEKPIPDEKFVGSAVMNFDHSCDIIIGVGSGVINDIGKILSKITSKPYIIFGTAPSMDGFASDSSSMERDGLKTSLASKCPDAIFGDTEILKSAPERMLISGLGDMIAKYTSLCEWKISNTINGEYYCETIAEIIRCAVKQCVDNAQKLLLRDEEAVKAVFEGLVIGGIAMAYAGCTRPASGVEHYFSHVWDMRGLSLGTPVDLHGIQAGIGSYISINMFTKLKSIRPDREKALKHTHEFDFDKHSEFLLEFIGNGAKKMIEAESKEQKYNKSNHQKRLEIIISKWNKILEIVKHELPSPEKLDDLFSLVNAPKTPSDIGLDDSIIYNTFISTKDIRDKYVLSRLAWDLGIEKDLFKED